MNESIREGMINKRALPFGFGAPIRPRSFSYYSGSMAFAPNGNVYPATTTIAEAVYGTDYPFTFVTGGTHACYSLSRGSYNRIQNGGIAGQKIVLNVGSYGATGGSAAHSFSGSWRFPSIQQRHQPVSFSILDIPIL